MNQQFFKEVRKGAKEFGISVKIDNNGILSAKYGVNEKNLKTTKVY